MGAKVISISPHPASCVGWVGSVVAVFFAAAAAVASCGLKATRTLL